MDLYDLLARPSLRGSPISILVRPTGRCDTATAARKAVELLREHEAGGEVLLLAGTFPNNVPARTAGHRIRIFYRVDCESGAALCEAMAAARHEIVVCVDERIALSREELAMMLEHLDYADVVIGRRSGRRGWLRWAWEWPIRVVLGIPQVDPLSPVKALRRAAVRELVLETKGPSVDLELLAKTNYLVSLIDEVPIADVRQGPSIVRALLDSNWREWLRPTLWRSSLRGEPANRQLSRAAITPISSTPHTSTSPARFPRRVATGWPSQDRLSRTRILRPGRR